MLCKPRIFTTGSIVLLLSIIAIGASTSRAYHIEKVADGHYEITCNDGTTILYHGNGDGAIDRANVWCEDRGGVAYFGDADVEDALDTASACGLESSVTIAKDMGGGNYVALTEQDVASMLSDVPFDSHVELPGYRPVSLIVNGVQLIPNPITNLASLPVLEIHSNMSGSTSVVSGTPVPEQCQVPISPVAVAGLAALLAGTLFVASRRRMLAS